MPLARIFTCYPQQTTALSEQLQQQGYIVEVLSPEQAPDTLADLEIQLEVCDPADVLRRATELAARLHADIAVAPGALQPNFPPEPAISDSPLLQEESIRATPIPAVPAPLPEEPAATLPVFVETHQLAPTLEGQDLETESQPALPSVPPRAARSLGAALAACASAAEKFLVFARDQFRESRGLAQVRLAQAQVLREQRLLDLARRKADVREQLLELRAGRHVLDAYLMQLKQQATSSPRQTQEHVVPMPEPAPVRDSLGSAWKNAVQRIHLGPREALIAGLMAAGALLAVALAVVAFNARPTLAKNDGGASQTGGVTLQASQPAVPAPARPSPAVDKPVANAPVQVSKLTPKPSPGRRASTKTARQNVVTQKVVAKNKAPRQKEEFVGNDVVVRRFPAAKPTPTPRTQANGWKHFSDISN